MRKHVLSEVVLCCVVLCCQRLRQIIAARRLPQARSHFLWPACSQRGGKIQIRQQNTMTNTKYSTLLVSCNQRLWIASSCTFPARWNLSPPLPPSASLVAGCTPVPTQLGYTHTHTLPHICFPDFALHRLAIFLLGILRFPFRHNCFLFFFFQSLYAAHHVWFKALQEYPDDPKVWFFQPLTNWLCVTPFPRSFPCDLPNAPRYSATCTFESLSGPGPWACQDTHTHVHNDKYGLWCNLKDQFVQCAQYKS